MFAADAFAVARRNLDRGFRAISFAANHVAARLQGEGRSAFQHAKLPDDIVAGVIRRTWLGWLGCFASGAATAFIACGLFLGVELFKVCERRLALADGASHGLLLDTGDWRN